MGVNDVAASSTSCVTQFLDHTCGKTCFLGYPQAVRRITSISAGAGDKVWAAYWRTCLGRIKGVCFLLVGIFKGNLPSISAANYIGSLFSEVFISDPKRGRFDSSTWRVPNIIGAISHWSICEQIGFAILAITRLLKGLLEIRMVCFMRRWHLVHKKRIEK